MKKLEDDIQTPKELTNLLLKYRFVLVTLCGTIIWLMLYYWSDYKSDVTELTV